MLRQASHCVLPLRAFQSSFLTLRSVLSVLTVLALPHSASHCSQCLLVCTPAGPALDTQLQARCCTLCFAKRLSDAPALVSSHRRCSFHNPPQSVHLRAVWVGCSGLRQLQGAMGRALELDPGLHNRKGGWAGSLLPAFPTRTGTCLQTRFSTL